MVLKEIKHTGILLTFFITGILCGSFDLIPLLETYQESLIGWMLNILLFIVGIMIGLEREHLIEGLKKTGAKALYYPLATMLGSIIAMLIIEALFHAYGYSTALATAAGCGYYSLTSVMVTKYAGAQAGALVLLVNLWREIITLLSTPFLIRFFGKEMPIIVGGATTMDVTLGVIIKFTDKRHGTLAFISGLILTIATPLLIMLLFHFI